MIGVLHYNAGNRESVARAVGRLDIPAETVATAEEIARVDGLIFPHGAAAAAMSDLQRTRTGWSPARLSQAVPRPVSGDATAVRFFGRGRRGMSGDHSRASAQATGGGGGNKLDTGRYAYFAQVTSASQMIRALRR